jgi:hypothetical protein
MWNSDQELSECTSVNKSLNNCIMLWAQKASQSRTLMHTNVKEVYEWLFWKGTQLVSIHRDSIQKCNKVYAKS